MLCCRGVRGTFRISYQQRTHILPCHSTFLLFLLYALVSMLLFLFHDCSPRKIIDILPYGSTRDNEKLKCVAEGLSY